MNFAIKDSDNITTTREIAAAASKKTQYTVRTLNNVNILDLQIAPSATGCISNEVCCSVKETTNENGVKLNKRAFGRWGCVRASYN